MDVTGYHPLCPYYPQNWLLPAAGSVDNDGAGEVSVSYETLCSIVLGRQHNIHHAALLLQYLHASASDNYISMHQQVIITSPCISK